MRAMILGAGEGRRMHPLTKFKPKPMLQINGKALIEYHIERLARAGVKTIVINTCYLGEQIEKFCADGARWKVQLHYSREREPLETAGGIIQALPLLGEDPFLVVSADIYTDYPYGQLICQSPPRGGGHLVLVSNPDHNPEGDFILRSGKLVTNHNWRNMEKAASEKMNPITLTYSGIGLFDPRFFLGHSEGKRPLRPLLNAGIDAALISWEHYSGNWFDIGTPERWEAANNTVATESATI